MVRYEYWSYTEPGHSKVLWNQFGKNIEDEEGRTIESSGENDGSEFETNRQNIVKKEGTTDSSNNGDIGLETYNTKGHLTRDVPHKAMEKKQGSSNNIVI